MKQRFSLEEYLTDQSRKVVTRDGKQVRIVCTNAKGDYPVVALAIDEDGSEYTIRSTQYGLSGFTEDDLFLTDEHRGKTIKEGWIALYSSNVSSKLYLPAGYVMTTKENEEKHVEKHLKDFVAIPHVTWEE